MSFATDKWFKHLREEILIEGLNDIGLTKDDVNRIRMDMPDASEKARVWVGNALKTYKLPRLISDLEASLKRAQRNNEYYIVKLIQYALEHKESFSLKKGDRTFPLFEEAVRTYLRDPIKDWKKAKRSFVKQRDKYSATGDEFETALKRLRDVEEYAYQVFTDQIENVMLTLNQNPNNYEVIKGTPPSDWFSAEKDCYEFQQNRENPDQIMHTFEDGSYWYDLQSSSCRVEGERMGHCGDDGRGNLYSLRKRDKGKRDSKSYVTIAYNPDSGIIFQIKGRANSCPPEIFWPHIEKFIDLTDADKLEETGQYSAEPEEFNRLGDYLSNEAGIQWVGSYEMRFNEFREECVQYENDFRQNIGRLEVQLRGLEIVESDYDEGFEWIDTLDTIVVEVPFKLKDRHLHKHKDDLGLAAEEILEVIEKEDRNDFISSYQENAEVAFIRADSEEDAMQKVNTYAYADNIAELVSAGSKTYMVLSDFEALSDQVLDDLNRSEPVQYREFLDLVEQLYTDVRDSVDAIEDLFIAQAIIEAPKVKGYKATVADRFNNFYVKNTVTNNRESFVVMANGKLFDTTADEMETIAKTGLAPDLQRGQTRNGLKPPLQLRRSDGWWTSETFKEQIIGILESKEKEAAEFAKQQMTLDFGEKYKEKISDLWDRILTQKKTPLSVNMFAGFHVKQSVPDSYGRAPRTGNPIRSGENAFFYKIEVIIEEVTLPVAGPFLEYYDNNFEILIGAFDKVVKDYIYKAAMRMRKSADTEDNLPLQEGLIVEGLADIGLSDNMVEQIRFEMPDASEKGRMWIGNAIKLFSPYGSTSREKTARRFYPSYQRQALATEPFMKLLLEPVEEVKDEKVIKALEVMPGTFKNSIKNGMPVDEMLEHFFGFVHGMIKDPSDPKSVRLFGSLFQVGEFNLLQDYWNKVISSPIKDWNKAKKSFIKSCAKKDINPEAVNKAVDFIDLQDEYAFNIFHTRMENTMLTLNQSPGNYQRAILFDRVEETEPGKPDKEIYLSISDFPPSEFSQVEEKAKFYQETLDNEEQIMYKFDNDIFWYDLRSSNCNVEARRMGHCGGDDRASLYSLRQRQQDGASSKSYVTIAYNDRSKEIFQIKGKFNKAPDKKFWPYIAEFIRQTGAKENLEVGEFGAEEEVEKIFEMSAYLTKETGIKDHTERQRLEQMRDNFRNQCWQYGRDLRPSLADALGGAANIAGNTLTVTTVPGDPISFSWKSQIDNIAIALDFNIEDDFILKYLRGEIGIEKRDEIQSKIFEILASKDRNNIIDLKLDKNEIIAIEFVRANDTAGAIRKSMRKPSHADAKGHSDFMVIDTGWGQMFEDIIARDPEITTSDPDGFKAFLEKIAELVEDIRSALPLVKEYLEKQGVLEDSDFFDLVVELKSQTNNFEFSAPEKTARIRTVEAEGVLMELTDSEIAGLKQIGWLRASGDGGTLNQTTFEKIHNIMPDLLKKMPGFPLSAIPDGTRKVANTSKTFDEYEFFRRLVTFITYSKPNKNLQYELYTRLKPYNITNYSPVIKFLDSNLQAYVDMVRKLVKEDIAYWLEQYKKEIGEAAPMQEARANPLDVRLYEIDFVMSYPLGQGFEITDIHNIVRAIPDVTTVRTIGNTKRTQGNRTVSLQRLKFALQGQRSRKDWVKQILIPQIHKISSTIRLHRVEPADLVSSSKQRLEELYYNSSMRQSSGRTTPVPTIQSLIDDWVEGGVMYDQPTNLNLTRYSVMMPVEDLKHLCGREARKHGHHFDAGYQKFIENGPRDPIYLAIGKNGRAKITGNEDDLRYAIKAGVEEVPVFISYQRQV